MERIRLQKYIAMCGVCSRRDAEELIKQGRVYVNGSKVEEMGLKITYEDKVEIDGNVISMEKKKYYIMMNKPTGVISAVSDDRGRKCVTDFIKGVDARLYPVGRLDYDTQGLILITNDGDFMQKLTHPSHEVWKTYEALVRGIPDQNDIKEFEQGLLLEDGMTLPCVLEVIGYEGKNAIVEVMIREGRNRQVRRMLERINHPVIRLKRTKIASLELGDLKPGQWRFLNSEDFKALNMSDREQA
ncbi:MAG TPA: pseudouridine synthase [Clostridia bacterium]|mgnify:CR=1 FL=1|jgi:pseudouridine synthase|nr:pseudouridine synthase [Clostridia bacterium]HPZ53276.1 pseudouridine synthase [Clostridia bacterium]